MPVTVIINGQAHSAAAGETLFTIAKRLGVRVPTSCQKQGKCKECLEQVQRGTLALTKTSAAPLGNFVSVIKIFSLPYIFDDRDHFWRVLDGPIGQDLLQAAGSRDDGKPSGFRGLCYFDSGSRKFYSSTPILSPADLAGLQIRVMKDEVAIDMVAAMGGVPQPIAFGELYTGLKQGQVQAAEDGIGFDRTETGSNNVAQYYPPVGEVFASVEDCPEKYLLWFHHLPWDHQMDSGRTLWEELCAKYYQGAEGACWLQATWSSLKGKIDPQRHAEVAERLDIQVRHAAQWRDDILGYFQQFSGQDIVPPEEDA